MSDKSAFEISKGFSPETIRSRGNYRRRGHGFTTGTVVFFNGFTSEWEPSTWNLDVQGSSESLGIIDATDSYRFDVVYRGTVQIPDSTPVTGPGGTIQENTVYFISDTAGMLTATPPEFSEINPKVRKPFLVTLDKTGSLVNCLVVNYRGYVEDSAGCVAFVRNVIPVGTIEIMPGGTKNPQDLNGWLLCDGSEYSIADYPELFFAIRTAYGTPSAIDKFKVPDFTTQAKRILLGTRTGTIPPFVESYGGNDNVEIVPTGADVILAGTGYADTAIDGNKQAAYHTNFYIRYKDIERYVNIETCNGAGGAIKNWMLNGSFDIWQRGTNFAPNIALTGTHHIADLNRYTADRWFRKVGYCPSPFGSVTGPSNYVGLCRRGSFANIETSLPEILRKQFPRHYMEYQSYINGPGEDTSMEYCILEHRIPSVKSLSGDQVCISFWAKADVDGFVYANLKQHFGYDVLPNIPAVFKIGEDQYTPSTGGTEQKSSLIAPLGAYSAQGLTNVPSVKTPTSANMISVAKIDPNYAFGIMVSGTAYDAEKIPMVADSSDKGGSSAIADVTVDLPNTKEYLYAKLAEQSNLSNSLTVPVGKKLIGIPTIIGDTGGVLGQVVTDAESGDNVVKIESKSASASDFVVNDGTGVNTETQKSIPVDVVFGCIPTSSCSDCTLGVKAVSILGTQVYTSPAELCVATMHGSGPFGVQSGQSISSSTFTLNVSDADYADVLNGNINTVVVVSAIASANELANQNSQACHCGQQETILGFPSQCSSMTTMAGYDPNLVQGICCVPQAGQVKFNISAAQFVEYVRMENSTVHDCIQSGGQFISYDAVDYFSQFDPTQCGVSEDFCSDYVKLYMTSEWQQYELVFRVPSVENRYIGNSGTDYLALQLWTHLSNGYCTTRSGVEANPRNRLGEEYGSVDCTQNALCEPCAGVFPLPFTYRGTIRFANFQAERGSEFTGYVRPSYTEMLDTCQSFYEQNSCAGESGYYAVTGVGFFDVEFAFKREKTCNTPRAIITSFGTNDGVSDIDIDTASITKKGFTVKGDVTNTEPYLAFEYLCDCDIYRPEEVQYLETQLELNKGTLAAS